MGSPPVIVDRPIPNRHLQMAFVERKQEVETFATKATAESFAHRVRLWGPQRRPQNPYTQIGKTSVDIRREYGVAIVDDEAVGMVARQLCSVINPFAVEPTSCQKMHNVVTSGSADVTSAIRPTRNVDLTSLPIARIVLILKAELFFCGPQGYQVSQRKRKRIEE